MSLGENGGRTSGWLFPARSALWVLLLLPALLFLTAAGAAAEGKPTGGVRPLVRTGSRAVRGGAGLDGPKQCITGTEFTWRLTGTDPRCRYELAVAVWDGSYADGQTADTVYDAHTLGTDTFRYTFYTPGKYSLVLDTYRDGTHEDQYWYDVTVADGGENEVTRIVRQAVADSRVPGDEFRTAANLHDWILEHCTYDYTYTYFDADALFLKGTGVCNTYSRAYGMLLREAGIGFRRVNGGGHAWNAVRIDGNWYHADCTWDDDDGAVDEFYRHRYCFVASDLLSADHQIEYYVGGAVSCVSLRDNYFIRPGTWYDFAWRTMGAYEIQLEEGYHWFSFAVVPYYDNYEDDYLDRLLGELIAWGMNGRTWEIRGRTYTGSFTYSHSRRRITGQHHSRGTLKLPGGLEMIGPGAFRNTAANTVTVPDGCTAIGEGAFAGADIWVISIPASVTRIAPDAFTAGMPVFIEAPENSYAAEYANRYGYRWLKR